MAMMVAVPRVFICHADKDKPFVEKINTGMNECQIDTWIDKKNIRFGRSWQDEIFEGGIPNVDVVFAYFTENTLQSVMAKKELDVANIAQMQGSLVLVLPFVSKKELIKRLRPDIGALQVGVLNEDNYEEVFPALVSEIWRTFGERRVSDVINEEKGKRVDLEQRLREFESVAADQVFTESEEVEFQRIYDKLNIKAKCKIADKRVDVTATIDFLPLYVYYYMEGEAVRVFGLMGDRYCHLLIEGYPKSRAEEIFNDYSRTLRMFGLREVDSTDGYYSEPTTAKHDRFLFWMEYREKLKGRMVIPFYEELPTLVLDSPVEDDDLPF